jgi:hypothetical protein
VEYDALQHEKPDIPALVNLYGKIGRMRVLSSPKVLASAEQIGQKITNMYLEPNKTFFELREMINKTPSTFLATSAKPAAKNTGRLVWR